MPVRHGDRAMTGGPPVSDAKARAVLGWTPEYPTDRQGLAELAELGGLAASA